MRRLSDFQLLLIFVLSTSLLLISPNETEGQDKLLYKFNLHETAGYERINEYIECVLQLNRDRPIEQNLSIVAQDSKNEIIIPCQIINQDFYPDINRLVLSIIFPISMTAFEKKKLDIKITAERYPFSTDLEFEGIGTELKIGNRFYKADLTKSDQSEAKSHASGQLRELLIKLNQHQLLFRTKNRMHWAPNFQSKGLEHYKTISAWDSPKINYIYKGPYLIKTERQDLAPEHPEILLSACYKFYANKPYFKFYSNMEMKKDIWLSLLRNDEMTMDSLFTHIAFKNRKNRIVDLPFSDRYNYLENNPISNEDPWLCFYNQDKGYAFGSIRIKYDISDHFGNPSPTYKPHTKISDGSGGGKYWNRRLIDEYITFVPKGCRYTEENAYLVFEIQKDNKFESIEHWSKRVRNPVIVVHVERF